MFFYRLLNLLLSPLTFGYVCWKAMRHKQLRYFLQRLGLGLKGIPKNCCWLHCASVGEVNTALPLLQELHRRRPAQNFLITTNTPTGADIVHRQQQPYLFHAYLPFDWLLSVTLFVNSIKPRGLYILETELWPNLFCACHSSHVPIVIINGRLSPRTTSTFKWVRNVLGRLLRLTEHIYARSEADLAAFIKLGAHPHNVSMLGNLKYSPPATKTLDKPNVSTDYVVAASTHDDEELQILRCWLKLERHELLVIAPRHPERRDAILQQLNKLTDAIALRSRNDAITATTKVYLLDTVGELNNWFAGARLVIIGGSFIPRGGHNLLEPAHFGKAVIFGPSMENFEDEARLMLDQHAAVQVADVDALCQQLQHFLTNHDALQSLENNVADASAGFRHIVADYADIISARMDANERQSLTQ
ncbi:MAG: glycosyltransferase N-terminal domain-containing protein [Gammaproteobacteria bacterium]|jgi:3-deoxy-D-manno-octulosonic-acid transferase